MAMNRDPSLELHDLPPEVSSLLQSLDVHPYLLAHLVLVHDVAWRLAQKIEARWPALPFDKELTLFGAATHDIGKVRHPEELLGTDRKHQEAGRQTLEALGVAAEKARFAQSHGAWREDETPPIEDLLVSLADTVWAGGRKRELEDRITERLAASDQRELWETFMDLDDILTELSRDAELRLVWQTQFAPDGGRSEQG